MKWNLLSPEDVHVAVGALRVAADVYVEDASACRLAFQVRVAEQFDRQAADARKLADRLEDGKTATGLPT